MSASPSGMSNGRTPTPNSSAPLYVRKAKAADPLRPRKKPVRRPPPPKPAEGNALKPNGPMPARPLNPSATNGQGLPAAGLGQPLGMMNGTAQPVKYDGWTHPPPDSYTDYPLVTTKRALREGLRYHIVRFAGKKPIDPSDQSEFVRPVTLHRRDPHQPPGRGGVKDEDMKDEVPVDSKERERQEILKAEKEKQRAIDLAQIAPSGPNNTASKKSQAFRNEKTTQVHRLDKTQEQKKASDLRYEEALPWHLEDAENKNIWVGTYEAALSDTNVVFLASEGKFQMIPVEKWYKFTAKATFKTFTIEEVEAKMSKKVKETRWAMQAKQTKAEENEAKDFAAKWEGKPLYKVKSESATFLASGKSEMADMDDLDFKEDDLFQDDDEQATVEPDEDEDTKDAQSRIKREQLGANVFDQANEMEVDKEFSKEEREKLQTKKLGKGVKKALKKRERNLIYDSDESDDNPFSDESDDDDTSDEEKLAEIDRKKDEEAKNKARFNNAPSGASSKGSNTPSNRIKTIDPLKHSKKRPGSPNLSESSGNESTLARKKHKKKHHHNSITGTSTPIRGSRPGSPVPMQIDGQPTQQRSGVGSDGEATEMSEGGTKKSKNRNKSNLSRAGSPSAGQAGSKNGSRAGSPAAPTANNENKTSFSKDKATAVGSGPIKPSDILAVCPPEGMVAGRLMDMFKHRLGTSPDKTPRTIFIQMIRTTLKYGPDKILRLP